MPVRTKWYDVYESSKSLTAHQKIFLSQFNTEEEFHSHIESKFGYTSWYHYKVVNLNYTLGKVCEDYASGVIGGKNKQLDFPV